MQSNLFYSQGGSGLKPCAQATADREKHECSMTKHEYTVRPLRAHRERSVPPASRSTSKSNIA